MYLKKCGENSLQAYNYSSMLIECLHDFSNFQNAYRNFILNDFKYKYRNREMHYMSIHQYLRQSIYGQLSMDSFSDREIHMSIISIRQLIEVRMRKGFGVMGLIDENDNIQPLDMSVIFDVVKKHKKNIEFCKSIDVIERIYQWSNQFIHSGIRDFVWIPIMIEKYLKEFSLGTIKADGSWNVANGIRLKKEILEEIHEELKTRINNKKNGNINLNIWECKPEFEHI